MEEIKERKINLQLVVRKIVPILRQARVTPEQVRYIMKCVRVQGKYQISNRGRKLPDYLNDAEIDIVLNKAMMKEPNTSLLVQIGIFTGLRIGEIHSLKIENIDFENRQLKVVQGKGSKDRQVILTTNVMQLIKAHIRKRDKGFVFVKSNGVQYSKRALQDRIKKVLDECNFDKRLSSHSLRHTFATLLLRRGLSIDKVQILMGHSNRKTTEIYSHLELSDIKGQFINMIG